MKISRKFLISIITAAALLHGCDDSLGIFAQNSRVADHTVIHELWDGEIAEEDIQKAVDHLHIAYGHTSHGSQIIDGMRGLIDFANGGNLGTDYSQGLFEFSTTGAGDVLHLFEGDGYDSGALDHDAGYYPDWVNETNAFLLNPFNNEYNVIIWSWCGQVSGYSEQDMIDKYLTPMSEFEEDHPDIVFVYMTGHLDGSGEDGNLHRRNEQIRAYCRENKKWLYDFADIESYDPDGNYYLDRGADDGCNYDGGNWAVEWQNAHQVGTEWYSCGAAHSQALNGNMKAYAMWWLLTEIAAGI